MRAVTSTLSDVILGKPIFPKKEIPPKDLLKLNIAIAEKALDDALQDGEFYNLKRKT